MAPWRRAPLALVLALGGPLSVPAQPAREPEFTMVDFADDQELARHLPPEDHLFTSRRLAADLVDIFGGTGTAAAWTVLELGSAHGHTTEVLSALFARVIAVDLLTSAHRAAAARGAGARGNVVWLTLDAYRDPWLSLLAGNDIQDACLGPVSLLHRDAALLRGTAGGEPQVLQLPVAPHIGNQTEISPAVVKPAETGPGSVGSSGHTLKSLLQAISARPGALLTELSRAAAAAHRNSMMAETQLDGTVWLILILLAVLLVILGYLYHNDWDTQAAGKEAERHAKYAAEELKKGAHAAAVQVEKATRQKEAPPKADPPAAASAPRAAESPSGFPKDFHHAQDMVAERLSRNACC